MIDKLPSELFKLWYTIHRLPNTHTPKRNVSKYRIISRQGKPDEDCRMCVFPTRIGHEMNMCCHVNSVRWGTAEEIILFFGLVFCIVLWGWWAVVFLRTTEGPHWPRPYEALQGLNNISRTSIHLFALSPIQGGHFSTCFVCNSDDDLLSADGLVCLQTHRVGP